MVFVFTEQFPELHGLEQQLHRLEAALKVDTDLIIIMTSLLLLGWEVVKSRINNSV